MCSIPENILENATLYKKYLDEQRFKQFGSDPYSIKPPKKSLNKEDKYQSNIPNDFFKSWVFCHNPMKKSNSYDILQIEPPKTQEEIRTAYRSLALEYHPDKPNGDHDKFIKITDAYHELRAC
tara:strand:- start:3444 stop:3812 length:369 start_codon:yes stop_codon:yes gene_type:complete